MSNINDLSQTNFPINVTCSFKEYPVVDEFHHGKIHNNRLLPFYINYQNNGQQNTTIPMCNPVGYEGFDIQQYPHNPFVNMHIKQESLSSSSVFPQYYQYQHPQPPTTIDKKTKNNVHTQKVSKPRANCIRTVFTEDQRDILENAFKIYRYASLEKRIELGKKLDLSENCILNWFKNRRYKQKRWDAQRGVKLESITHLSNSNNTRYSQIGIDEYKRLIGYLSKTSENY